MTTIKLTIFTKPAGIMTKNIELTDDQLVKDGSQCRLSTGTAETVTMSFNKVPAYLDTLKVNQAVAWGISEHQKTKIVKQSIEASTPDAISRTKQHYSYPSGPGVMMLDNDTGMGTDELITVLTATFPALKGIARIERPSCSAGIYKDEMLMTNEDSGRIYVLVDDGSQIPRIGKNLQQRLILAGRGHTQITRTGSVLVRSLIDDCVWQAERLDFVAAPVLGNGLKRRVPKAKYVDGTALVAADVKDLSDTEERC